MSQFDGLERVPSPALLLDVGKVAANLQEMISIAGVDRLRPHLKTHKMREVVQLQIKAGIRKFKAATLAELEMAADAGAAEILLAIQPVGPNMARLAEAIAAYPETSFSAVIDDLETAALLDRKCQGLGLFIDVDCGMHRTGVAFGSALDLLIQEVGNLSQAHLMGLHVYDGHLHDSDRVRRRASVLEIHEQIQKHRKDAMTVIAGGSPTFGLWAEESHWDCSPGTSLFWDQGYRESFPELPFEMAAVLLTRVISKPGENRLCLDLGHKAVAAENPLEQRVILPDLPQAKFLGQSEEHLVIEVEDSHRYKIGDPLLAYPRHICPTVALHRSAHLMREGRFLNEEWRVAARDR
ncbi:MAG: D-serine deaminase-like pyridoxal phosphate-dependent protein [Akkermansiaceae bacterium]|jgi:D-serine deaminase-like pyridoxal phosphate-dependent protein